MAGIYGSICIVLHGKLPFYAAESLMCYQVDVRLRLLKSDQRSGHNQNPRGHQVDRVVPRYVVQYSQFKKCSHTWMLRATLIINLRHSRMLGVKKRGTWASCVNCEVSTAKGGHFQESIYHTRDDGTAKNTTRCRRSRLGYKGTLPPPTPFSKSDPLYHAKYRLSP